MHKIKEHEEGHKAVQNMYSFMHSFRVRERNRIFENSFLHYILIIDLQNSLYVYLQKNERVRTRKFIIYVKYKKNLNMSLVIIIYPSNLAACKEIVRPFKLGIRN